MRLAVPCSSAILSEARLYAIESNTHTMDYEGWKDQHNKLRRLTYGKFAQLWVYEFCRVNGIRCEKDKSGPTEPDNKDLVICGLDVDVKASTIGALVGQISPGMYNKSDGFYCFARTNETCSFILPIGFLHCSLFIPNSIEVRQGETIPHTTIVQRFRSSRFLSKGAPVVPFFEFMADAKAGEIEKHIPLPRVEASDLDWSEIPF